MAKKWEEAPKSVGRSDAAMKREKASAEAVHGFKNKKATKPAVCAAAAVVAAKREKKEKKEDKKEEKKE